MRVLFLLAIVLAVAYTASAVPRPQSPRRCRSGEVWRTCGPACQPTCRNRQGACPGRRCVAACNCISGMVRRYPGGICTRICPRIG
ncbi:chymotrypsin inhibitor-like [Fopius arisanus]|uniref:Chymotrypsin inhibitor-like n=1 Tax=Fopius arisanus TaxID=64838 RepID=A0A9R1TZV6_9HYME|nr:PREDICTED: chymotrypsin inhibitor-like [Fopius arisanus]